MIWMMLFGLFAFLLGWILFAPIYLRVEWNDTRQLVAFQWSGIFQVQLLPEEEEWRLHFQVLWFKKQWPVLDLVATPSKPSPKKAKRSKKSWKPRHPFKLFRRLWQSFHLIRFHLYLDSDDYVLNAYLFPLFQQVSRKNKLDWAINFNGKNELTFVTENRLARMIYAFISSL